MVTIIHVFSIASDNSLALIGDKSLSEPMMAYFSDT